MEKDRKNRTPFKMDAGKYFELLSQRDDEMIRSVDPKILRTLDEQNSIERAIGRRTVNVSPIDLPTPENNH